MFKRLLSVGGFTLLSRITGFARDILMAAMLGIPAEKVHVIAHYIGGGFGSKGFTWANPLLAAMAAKQFGRPVKIALKCIVKCEAAQSFESVQAARRSWPAT